MFPHASLGVHRNLAGKMAVMNQRIVPLVEWNTGMTVGTSKSIVAHLWWLIKVVFKQVVDLEGGVRGVCPPPPPSSASYMHTHGQ